VAKDRGLWSNHSIGGRPVYVGSNPTGAIIIFDACRRRRGVVYMEYAELLGLDIKRHRKNYVVKIRGMEEGPTTPKVGWKRSLSKLVEDRVILDYNAGKEFLETEGDVTIYEVINLWRFVPGIAEISERSRVYCDITVLDHGIISTTGFGELFLTYGHDHTRRFGEIYSVLAGKGNLIMYMPGINVTKVVRMKKGDEYYIPPGWVHRFYCSDEGVVLAGFVPHEAGHKYETVKGRGFPYHLFYDEEKGEVMYMKNPKFERAELEILDGSSGKGWVPKFFGAAMELRRQLEKEE